MSSTKTIFCLGTYITDLEKEEYFVYRYSKTDKEKYIQMVFLHGDVSTVRTRPYSRFVCNTNSYGCTCFGKEKPQR